MQGLGFVVALRTLSDADEQWHELSAGLVVTHIVALALHREPSSASSLEGARRCVRRVTKLSLGRHLQEVLDASALAARGDQTQVAALCRLMFAYGVRLHDDGAYTAAIDVFDTLLGTRSCESDLRAQVLLRRAFAYRLLARFDDAELTYHELMRLATEVGSLRLAMEGELGVAKLFLDRGNVPAAEELVEEIIRRAEALGEMLILEKALIDRARIAGIRRRPFDVLVFSHRAAELASEPARRDRSLLNTAVALHELGRHEASRQLAARVARAASHAEPRACAENLLYRLAVNRGDRRECDRLAEALRRTRCTPAIEAEFHEIAADHQMLAGDRRGALRHLATALRISERYRLSELVVRADLAIGEIRSGRRGRRADADVSDRAGQDEDLTDAIAEHALALASA